MQVGEDGRVGEEIKAEPLLLPYLASDLYPLLPQFFTDVLNLEKRLPHEADAIVLALLPMLGSAFRHFEVYEKKWAYPAVYTTIIGKPASGKGAASEIQFITKLRDSADEMMAEGKEHAVTHRLAIDVTLAKLIEQMRDNGEDPVFIFDSEMNTMAVANKNRDTGGYDPVLNKSYEGEMVQRSTKTAGNIRVQRPLLQLCLTGTKDQFFNAFQTNQNGLSSRLTGYVMPDEIQYKKLGYGEDETEQDKRKVDIQQRFYRMSGWDLTKKEAFSKARWKLTRAQTNRLNKLMRGNLETASESESGTVIRSRAKIIRYAAILSMTRMTDPAETFEPKQMANGEFYIDDHDFEIARMISETTIEHNFALQSILTANVSVGAMRSRPAWRDKLFAKLPDHFRYSEARKICKEKFNIGKTQFQVALKEWSDKELIHQQDDKSWVKVKPATSSEAENNSPT